MFDGMSLYALTDLMESLGCIEALNLDGGGSSTLIFDDTLKNSPYGDEDEDEGLGQNTTIRRVSDAIIILPR